jgi:hypothetical protein
MVRRLAGRALLTLAVAASGLAVAATPAMAADMCDSYMVCMYEDFNYDGSMYVRYTEGTRTGNRFEIDGWNGDNEISSVHNNTDLWVVMYDNDNYTGTKACIRPHGDVPNLATSNGYDNRAESFILKSSCV